MAFEKGLCLSHVHIGNGDQVPSFAVSHHVFMNYNLHMYTVSNYIFCLL